MGVIVVTDSSSDVSAAVARQHGIDVLPLWIVYGSERLRDGVDITRAAFYSRLATSKDLPQTEPIDEAAFAEAFAKHTGAGNEVVVTVVSSGLSKTYANAVAAAGKFGDKVRVVDSLNFSGGILLQVLAAVEMAKGGARAKDIAEALERGKATQHGYLVMPDLTYLGRTGRLNKAVVALGTIMKVNPVLQLKNGLVETAAQTRTYEKAQDLLIEIATRNVGDVAKTRFAVGHTNAPELGERVAAALKSKLGFPPKSFTIYEGGPTVALHGGPGAIGVFSIANV
jgi:DegV family protein with EDD domain